MSDKEKTKSSQEHTAMVKIKEGDVIEHSLKKREPAPVPKKDKK